MQSRALSPLRRCDALRAVFGASLFLICFLLAAGSARAEGSSARTQKRTISVNATGSVTISPDMAVVRLGVETRSSDVGRAIEEAATRTRAITRAVEGDGVAAKDIATVEYNIGFVPTSERSSGVTPVQPGGSLGGRSGVQAGYYRVTDFAAITVRDLAKLGKILDDALSAGANDVQGVSFRIADPTLPEKEARSLAYRDAHAKAAQLAALAGEKLGRVLEITTSGVPQPVGSGFRAAALAAPSVNPGSLEVRVSLQVVYEMGGS